MQLAFQYILALLIAVSVPDDRRFKKSFILSEVNAVRAIGCQCGDEFMPAVDELKWDEELYKTAAYHARDMERRAYFSHYSPSGYDAGDRLDAIGYRWKTVGENLAMGQKNFNEVIHDWKESETHCKMLMSSKVDYMGLAKRGKYWVQVFASK